MTVRTGLDRLRDDDFASLQGSSIGLLCHPASVDSKLNHVLDLMLGAGLQVPVVFGPEHGASGTAQDMEAIEDTEDTGPHKADLTQGRIISLYGSNSASLHPTGEMLDGLDVLLVDLQDVGSRYYTFAVTMRYCMQACAKAGVRVVVLDRPNPIGGAVVEGPVLKDLRSFVGGFGVPVRHGLTIGELALLAVREGVDVELDVVAMDGWHRSMWFDQTGLEWVMPSPNMPTLDTATVYPGSCLVEATNLSEARGTTRPFELIGAPWLDPVALSSEMNKACLPGVRFRPVTFCPTFQKHAGKYCGGVQIHIMDRDEFEPFRSGVELLDKIRKQDPEHFAWRKEPYEFVSDPPALDLLTGSDRLRLSLERGEPLGDIIHQWQQEAHEFQEMVRDLLLYD